MSQIDLSMVQPEGLLNRKSAFSYTCHRCSRFCYHKQIQVNPYEIARLARNKGISTTDFIASYLEPGKPYLDNHSDGACVLLTEEGCGVHADRPLVCRIYPLEQRVTGEGVESFHHAKPHPMTEGVYGREGTIEDFLLAQGVMPFLEVRDRYVTMVYRLLDLLAEDVDHSREVYEITTHTLKDDAAIQAALRTWLDLDAVVAQYCLNHGLEEPADLDARLNMYLTAMEAWIAHLLEGENHEEQCPTLPS
jgi:Fe-S-cluster containining protein